MSEIRVAVGQRLRYSEREALRRACDTLADPLATAREKRLAVDLFTVLGRIERMRMSARSAHETAHGDADDRP